MPYKDDIHFAVDAGGRDDFLPSAIGGKRGRNNTRQKRKVQAKLAPKRCERESVSDDVSIFADKPRRRRCSKRAAKHMCGGKRAPRDPPTIGRCDAWRALRRRRSARVVRGCPSADWTGAGCGTLGLAKWDMLFDMLRAAAVVDGDVDVELACNRVGREGRAAVLVEVGAVVLVVVVAAPVGVGSVSCKGWRGDEEEGIVFWDERSRRRGCDSWSSRDSETDIPVERLTDPRLDEAPDEEA